MERNIITIFPWTAHIMNVGGSLWLIDSLPHQAIPRITNKIHHWDFVHYHTKPSLTSQTRYITETLSSITPSHPSHHKQDTSLRLCPLPHQTIPHITNKIHHWDFGHYHSQPSLASQTRYITETLSTTTPNHPSHHKQGTSPRLWPVLHSAIPHITNKTSLRLWPLPLPAIPHITNILYSWICTLWIGKEDSVFR